MGATRRLNHYDVPGWQPLFIVASIGVVIILFGLGFQILQLLVSIKNRKENMGKSDPWNARTLEWSTASPPPFYNFAFTPEVHERDAFWAMKHAKTSESTKRQYHAIHMPKNTPVGFYIGLCSFFLTFSLIWHLFWLAAISTIGVLAFIIKRLFEKETEYFVPASEVEKIEMRTP